MLEVPLRRELWNARDERDWPVEMPRKLRELRADLRRAGFTIARQRGSHQTWQHPLTKATSIVLSGADGADAKPYQEGTLAKALQQLDAARDAEEGRGV